MIKLLLFFILLSITPVFAEESQDSAIAANLTDIIVLNDTEIQNNSHTELSTTIIFWNIGIFAIIGSAFAMLAILLTVRFIFFDVKYKEKITFFETRRFEKMMEQEKLIIDKKYKISDLYEFSDLYAGYSMLIVELRKFKTNNIHMGPFLDVGSMILLFTVGLLATLGVFEDIFIILIIIVISLVVLPVSHFLWHLRKIKKMDKVNRSELVV